MRLISTSSSGRLYHVIDLSIHDPLSSPLIIQTMYLPDSKTGLAIGDISVLNIKTPSVGLSARGRSTLAVTRAATLYVIHRVSVLPSYQQDTHPYPHSFYELPIDPLYLVRPSCTLT